MLIVLIRPPSLLPLDSITAHQGVPPLSLAYLGAILKKNNFNVFYIDAFGEKINSFSKSPYENILVNGLTSDEVVLRIPSDCNLIGISCMFSNEWFYIDTLINKIKKNFPKIKIVLGGEHATSDCDYILQTNKNVDVIISGEGEYKLLNLVRKLSQNFLLKDIEGISYFSEIQKAVVHNKFTSHITDINQLPWPDWEFLPLESYLSLGLGMASQNKRTLPMLASRGCPYQCRFCSSSLMWASKWVSRDVQNVLNEMTFFSKKYHAEHVEFYDLTAIIDKNWIVEFCNKKIEQKINLTWSLPSGTRSEVLTDDVLKLLYKSGCQKLTYAPETGSNRILKLIKKKVDLNKMQKSMSSAVQNGIIVKVNMIFGLPEQTFVDVFFDFLFILRLAFIGVHDLTCFAFSPYPGSELFIELTQKQVIKKDDTYHFFLSRNVYNSPLSMKSWSRNIPHWTVPFLTLGGMSFFYILQFIFRPLRFYKLVRNFIHNTPRTMLDLALAGIKNDFFKGRKRKIEN